MTHGYCQNGTSGTMQDNCYPCNLQDPVAPGDLIFKRQFLYCFGKIFHSLWDSKAAETFSILEDDMCSLL